MRGDNQLARLAARLGTRRAGVLLGVRVPILGGGVVVVAVLVVAVVVVVAAAGGRLLVRGRGRSWRGAVVPHCAVEP